MAWLTGMIHTFLSYPISHKILSRKTFISGESFGREIFNTGNFVSRNRASIIAGLIPIISNDANALGNGLETVKNHQKIYYPIKQRTTFIHLTIIIGLNPRKHFVQRYFCFHIYVWFSMSKQYYFHIGLLDSTRNHHNLSNVSSLTNL